ncbi:hypothetical protein Tco_1419309 [Tanacetum coccineum]
MEAIVQATNPRSTMEKMKNGRRKRRSIDYPKANLGDVRLMTVMISPNSLNLFSWVEQRIAMVPPKVKSQLPNTDVKVEEKIVKGGVVREYVKKPKNLMFVHNMKIKFQLYY